MGDRLGETYKMMEETMRIVVICLNGADGILPQMGLTTMDEVLSRVEVWAPEKEYYGYQE
jgi:hypothetical protein